MNNNIHPPNRTVVPPESYASRGIGKPYTKEYREQVMSMHDNFRQELASRSVIAAQNAHIHVVNEIINRWL